MPPEPLSNHIARLSRAAYVLMLSTFVTGLAWLALLPPGEGFDELGHYSYIQQVADAGVSSVFVTDRLSSDAASYQRNLPSAYTSVAPFDDLGDGISYRRFFSMPLSQQATSTLRSPRSFTPSGYGNAESQHPFLFYFLLAPVYSLSRQWNWLTQIFLLRSVAWIFAFIGYSISIIAITRYWPTKNARMMATIAAAWPFLVPMFFPEMARIGNDSLCILLMGTIFGLLLRINSTDVPTRYADYIVIGVLLGLGLLTKAFFIPITAGVALALFFRGNTKGLVVVLALALSIGGPWYLYKFVSTGVFSGGYEQIALARQGGLVRGLVTNFNIRGLMRGLLAVVASAAWGGTASLARFHELFLAPLAVLLVGPILACFIRLRRTRLKDFSWSPVFIVSMFVAGLVHHVLVALAMTGIGNNTPGWYLHILAGPMGFIYSLGLLWVLRFRAIRVLFPALALYSLAFLAVLSWVQVAMYAGCAAKLGSVKYYAFPDGASCLLDLRALTGKLAIIAEPQIGMPLLFCGIVSGGVGLGMLYAQLRLSFLEGSREKSSAT